MNYNVITTVILASSLFFCKLEAYRYDFAICAVFQNEARFLKEWIEYHKIVGAQHFYLYNNESQDEYLKVLQPYLDEGSVELIEWNVPDFQHSGQKRAYLDAIGKSKENVKWLAIIDLDEYLVPKAHDSIVSWLSEYENEGIGGIGINWQMFGTSFVPKIEQHQLLTERLTLKALENHSENIHIKSIVRPEYVVEPVHIHHFEYREGYAQVNSNKEPFTGPFSPYVATDKIQINHYWTKDEEFLHETKIPRRQNWGETLGSIEERVNVLNQVEDTSIARFLPALRRQMFGEKGIEFRFSNHATNPQTLGQGSGPFFRGGSYDLGSPNEIAFSEPVGFSAVGHLLADLSDSGEELVLPAETISHSIYARVLKPLLWLLLVAAVFTLLFAFTRSCKAPSSKASSH